MISHTFRLFRQRFFLLCLLFLTSEIQAQISPMIQSITNSGDNAVVVVFSLSVQPASATNVSNYALTNLSGRVTVIAAAFGADNKTIQLTTASQAPYAAHWMHIGSVTDAATGTNAIVPNSLGIYTNVPFSSGYIMRQLYLNIGGSTAVSALTGSAKFPNSPDQVDFPSSMGWPQRDIADSYGGRFSGLLAPTVSGQYFFAVSSDDASQLFLSSNENPALKTLLTAEPGCCEAFDAHTAGPINLIAGKRYFIEALMKEGGGGDYLYVAWKTPTNNLSWTIIPGGFLGNYFMATNSSVTISQPPANSSVMVGQSASFSVIATGASALTTVVSYQWQSNGFDLPGAISAMYSTPAVNASDNGAQYRVLVSVPGAGRFSASATLTVTPDVVPPNVVRALNLGATNVQLVFSEPVEAASATNLANYAFANGLPISFATLATNLSAVTLTTAPLLYGSNYVLVINGVRDRAAVPNTIAANTIVSLVASPFAPQDIGTPPISGTSAVLANGVQVTASGNDIGGLTDQFGFDYQLFAGNFDVSVQLAGLIDSDPLAKAGLMARETLDAGSRFAATLATPAINGDFFEYRNPAASASITTGAFPANYPNTWLRLKRFGNVFTGFAGYDGVTWTQLGTVTLTLPSQIYFGLAVCSHNPAQTATAQFVGPMNVGTNTVSGTPNNPHEAIGPSSRKSPIVISEIMYKPAPRVDGRNLEYLEIYNSNPWFHDIGGYQLISKNLTYTFPNGTILPGGAYLVVAAVPGDLQALYGIPNVAGPYVGSLKKSDTLELHDEHGAVLLSVPYSNVYPWPVAADGTGHSIVLANPTYGEADPRAWEISDVVGGSPGQMEAFRPSPLRSVVINELLPYPGSSGVLDFAELYNHSKQTNDLSGCVLTDDPATNKYIFPAGTVIVPMGFRSLGKSQLGFGLSASGGTIYLLNPDRSRVLDAVQFAAQAEGVSFGRWPDGASAFYPLAGRTPGTNNSPILSGDIVINELMYNPISGNDDDQYVELYNKGTNLVNLSGWQFTSKAVFTFPTNTVLAPDSYLVIARNQTNLWAKYPNLNNTNTVGNYAGKLSHGGDRVALTIPLTLTNSHGAVTNTSYVVDELTYEAGGRWGQWAAGGGSSLELIDPRANHRLAANWGDSDETHKSAWANIETTGVLDNGANFDPTIDYAQIGILDVGECLVDNLEVHPGTAPTNYVSNLGFETGLVNWTRQGCHVRSSLENEGYSSGHSLHIRCSDRFWTGVNSCEVALTPNSLAQGQTATLRFKARWLHGWPEVLFRLNGNWLEATGALPIPANLGTPGARNSLYVTNAGPAVYQVSHSPAVPAAGQAAVVTARIHDPDGVQALVLFYRIDPATAYAPVTMKDDGSGGDAVANDGIYSGTIPGQPGGTIVAFYLSAQDTKGAATRFPALLNDNAPVRECVVMFGDGNPTGSFGVYHLWVTQTNATRWSNFSDLSNESHDCTIVNGNRVIYDAQARFAGSPYHQGFDTPYGNLCHYKWIFPEDDKFLGATSFNKLHQPGNGAGDDSSIQREQLAHTFLRALGVPWLNRRYVVVYVNGNRRGTLMEDTQCPDGDVIKEYYPNDSGGFLFKMQPWFEFGPAPSGSSIAVNNNSWCTLSQFTTTGGAQKVARYRYNYLSRRTPDSASNYTNVFSLVAAASSYGTPNYVANMENIADMENWMRVFAANHAAGNWDSFGAQNEQNLYGYIGTQGTKYSLLMWDYNIVIGNSGSWNPGENLFTINGADPNMINLYQQPEFRRMYWRALQELVNGPLNLSNSGPLLDAKFNVFAANNLSVENPNTSIKGWLSSAQSSIASQIAAVDGPFTLNLPMTIVNDVGTLSGTAPIGVKSILINGVPWPLTWTSVTGWTITVPLVPGSNALNVTCIDLRGVPVPGASNFVSVIYSGVAVPPTGQLVINEIMYNPAVPNSQYVELYNRSSTYTFDLSGWQLRGLGYTFPPGSLIFPNSYLVLASDRTAFAAAYGATRPVFDTFRGNLPPNQGDLLLVQPGASVASDTIVARVKYSSAPPWPAGANGSGASLQLIDSSRDNWRVGNWTSAPPSPGAANPPATALPLFPPLWISEVEAENLTGVTNSAGQRTPWLELYNPSGATIPLAGLYLSSAYTNLTLWAFPGGVTIGPGQFKVIFADGFTGLSTTSEPHTSFTLHSGSGSVVLSRLNNGVPQVLDYVDYTNLTANHSFGSFPDGQSFDRQEFFLATPGGTNSGFVTSLTVVINEWMASNTHTIGDPLDSNKADDWFELYNYGPNIVNLAGYYLTDSLTNQFKFLIPSGYTIPAHGFLLVWADKKSTTGSSDLHVNFRLSKGGTSIGLYEVDGNPVDYVSFGAQNSDVSQGRVPDGCANLAFMPNATPRTNNIPPNTAPILQMFPDKVVTLGQTLMMQAIASDAEAPPQSLTFSLTPDAPIGAFINASRGQLTWTPNLAPATNNFGIVVSDNGTPSLSATQSVTVRVVLRPEFGQLTINKSKVSLSWSTAAGQGFQIEYSDELNAGNWVAMGGPMIGAGVPLTLTVDVASSTARFYRLRILPP